MIASMYKPIGSSVRDKIVSPHRRIAIYGYNEDVDTGAEEDVWSGGGIYPWLTTTTALKVVSNSASDTSSGVGACTITIVGLDINYNEVTQVITLNGLTSVNIPTSLYRINTVVVTTAGTSQTNVGTVTVSDVASATARAVLIAGHGTTRHCTYTVPAGYELVITSVLVSINRTNTNDRWASMSSWLRTPSGVILQPAEIGISSAAPYRDKYDVPAVLSTGYDVAMRCQQVSANNTSITASIMGHLGKI